MATVRRNHRVFQTGSMPTLFPKFLTALRDGSQRPHRENSYGARRRRRAVQGGAIYPEEAMEPGLDWISGSDPPPSGLTTRFSGPRGVHDNFPTGGNYR